MSEMTDEHFAHMLKLATVYIPVMRNRSFFDGIDDMDDADIHNALNCLEIVADTFVEMQRRLGAKPRFRRAAITHEKRDE
jgi:hypothetical protein